MADKIVKDLSDNFLICCICMSHFKTPKMLPCIHSFCQECLMKYANTQKGNGIVCPTCRKVCTLPESGVKGLQTNFHLVNLAEKVTLLEKLTSPKKKTNVCDSCKHQEVVAFCFDCNFAVCSKCKDQHALFPVLRSHTVVPVEEVTDPKFQTGWRKSTSPFCDMHTSEKLNFYCKTCSKLICRDCTIVMHSKPDHEYLDVVTQVSSIREALTNMLDKSNENLTKGLNFIKRGKEGSEAIGKTSSKLKNEIAEHCLRKIEEMEKMLNDQKSSLIEAVSRVETEKVENIEEKLKIAEDWVGRMKNAQDLTQHVIQEDNPWELLGMSADLMNAFETLQIESKELDWFNSHLQQELIFSPGQLPGIHLGSCDLPCEVAATDPDGNFILCHFDDSDKMLYLRMLTKGSSYCRIECFPPYQWKHEIPIDPKLKVTVGNEKFLYVELGMVVAIFNLRSKECLNEQKVYAHSKPNDLTSCIAYSQRTLNVCICMNENTLDYWDADCKVKKNSYALKHSSMFMIPSEYDVLFGCKEGKLQKYHFRTGSWTEFLLPPPREFIEGEILFYEGLRTKPVSFGSYGMYLRQDYVCFVAWLTFKPDEKSNQKSKRWILKEYCTQNKVYVGVLDDLGGEEVEVPAALYCKELNNGGMEIHLCDSKGKVTSYKRDGNQNNPASYYRYNPKFK